jgi:hypothetical protein
VNIERDYATVRLGEEIDRVLDSLCERVALDDSEIELVFAALRTTAIAGVRVGVAECVAQAVAQGTKINCTLELIDPGFDDTD